MKYITGMSTEIQTTKVQQRWDHHHNKAYQFFPHTTFSNSFYTDLFLATFEYVKKDSQFSYFIYCIQKINISQK